MEEEGLFVFIDGVATNNSNTGWGPDQPDNWLDNEDCATINNKHLPRNTLNDVDCALLYKGICEKKGEDKEEREKGVPVKGVCRKSLEIQHLRYK